MSSWNSRSTSGTDDGCADDDEPVDGQSALDGEECGEAAEGVRDDRRERSDRVARPGDRRGELRTGGRWPGGVAMRGSVEGDDAITRRDERIDERSQLRPSPSQPWTRSTTGPAPHAVARRPSGSRTGDAPCDQRSLAVRSPMTTRSREQLRRQTSGDARG